MSFCQKCGYELPEGSNFCPQCGASIQASPPLRSPKEKDCPKCGAVMRAGFIVERDSPLSLWTLGEGIYWTPSEAGVIGERVSVKAYACPQCGYIEYYIRRLEKDRNIMLCGLIRAVLWSCLFSGCFSGSRLIG